MTPGVTFFWGTKILKKLRVRLFPRDGIFGLCEGVEGSVGVWVSAKKRVGGTMCKLTLSGRN